MRTTTIECPECAGHGGEGVYCDECLSTGQLTVTGAVAEAIDILRADLAAATQRAEAAEHQTAILSARLRGAVGAEMSNLLAERDALRERSEAAEAQGFYAGIISALGVLRLHGAETIWQEVVDLCDTQALLAHAKANDEIEFAGLDKWLDKQSEVQS